MSRFWASKRSVYAPFEKQNQLGRVIILLCKLDGNRKRRQAGGVRLGDLVIIRFWNYNAVINTIKRGSVILFCKPRLPLIRSFFEIIPEILF